MITNSQSKDSERRVGVYGFASAVSYSLSSRVAGRVMIALLSILSAGRFAPRPVTALMFSDSAVFGYFGQQILAGALPYRDLWDRKPPLIYYLNALALLVSHGSYWGVWILGAAALMGGTLIVYGIASRVFQSEAAGFLAGVSLLGCSFVPIEILNLTEVYALPLQAALIALFLSQRFDRSRMAKPILAGILAALLFLLRQNLIGTAVTVVALELFGRLRDRDVRSAVRFLTLAAASSVAILAPIAVYFWRAGGLWYLYDAAFRSSFAYSHNTMANRILALGSGTVAVSGGGILLLALAAAGFHLMAGRTHADKSVRRLFALCVFGLGVEIVFSSLSGRPNLHYFLPWTPYLALLAAGFAYFVAGAFLPRGSAPQELRATRLLEIILSAVLLLFLLEGSVQTYHHGARPSEATPVAQFVRNHTTPEDSIYVWGYWPEIYLLSQRRSPTRYFFLLPLEEADFKNTAIISEIAQGLEKGRPKLIIDPREPNGGSPPIDEPAQSKWAASRGKSLSTLQPLFEFIERNYVPVQAPGIEQSRVYRLRVN